MSLLRSLSKFGKHRRALLASLKKDGHKMCTNVHNGPSPWDKDESDVYRSDCANCDFAVQTYEQRVRLAYPNDVYEIKTHFFRNVPGSQVDSEYFKCEGRQ